MSETVGSGHLVSWESGFLMIGRSDAIIPMHAHYAIQIAFGAQPGRTTRDVLLGQLDEGRGDAERAAAGHRVACVDREVEHDLLELARVEQHRRQRPQVDLEPDVVAQGAGEDLADALDSSTDVDGHG